MGREIDPDVQFLLSRGWIPFGSGLPGVPGTSWSPDKFVVRRWTKPGTPGSFTKYQAIQRERHDEKNQQRQAK